MISGKLWLAYISIQFQVLGLNSNNLRDVPNEVKRLSNLQVLGLNFNQLSCLPSG